MNYIHESLNRKTVLIVDDEPLSIQLLRLQLEEDYSVIVANGGHEALLLIPRAMPDIILLDLIMPDMDGYEVYRAIRMLPELDSVPVLFITVMSDVECETAGLKMGAHDYIHKPFVADLVRLRIKNHLEFSQERGLLLRRSEELQELNKKLQEEIASHHAETLIRNQLERQYNHAQKLESLGILAGGIAHDFNNILTVILGHCYLAAEELIPDKEYTATFKKVEVAAQRAADLCRQMLTYAGKSRIELMKVNLWLLVDDVVKILQAALNKNVIIELDLQPEIPEIMGDSGQIQQIVMNLIINAAEAIGTDNGTIRIVLSRTTIDLDYAQKDALGVSIPPGKYVSLTVSDTGCGMDKETQSRIFEPFFTTKITGRGLGMSAICGIIKSHDGILQLVSTAGVGTTFTVNFPVVAKIDEIVAPIFEPPHEKTGGTVLLVDDEEILRSMGEVLLDAFGFSTITAQNGYEALEVYRSRSSDIDIVLMDLIMPVMGGIETYHELRGIAANLPVIICSGYDEDSIAETITNDPHAGFVHKPYKPKELRDMMIAMMKKCRSSCTQKDAA